MASTPTFRSLTQPLLVAGGERTPVALVAGGALLCGTTAWFSWSIPGAAATFLLLTIGIGALREAQGRGLR